MKTFVVILAIAATVKSDISLGYHYKNPQTSYEAPSYNTAGSGSAFGSGYTGQGVGSVYKGQALNSGSNLYQTSNAGLQNGYPNQVQSSGAGYQSGSRYQSGSSSQHGGGYQTGIGSHPIYQSSAGYQTGTGYQNSDNYQSGGGSSSGNQYQSSGSTGTYTGGSSGIAKGQNQYQTSNQYQSNSASYQQYYNQPPQIFKHFYVHAAPEEPELARPRQPLVLPAPQKHYKIIFIKTPAPAANSAQFIPVQQQNEEKTIVYVLVKKPEAAEDVVLPQVEQKPPSKPEVYFIKYKGKEDSQAVINNIVSEYNNGKGSVNIASAATQSGGSLDEISDTKYVSHSVSSGSQSGNNGGQTATQESSGSFETQSYESGGSSAGQSLNAFGINSGSSTSGLHLQSGGISDGSSGYQVSTVAPVYSSTGSSGYDSVSSTSSSSVSGGSGQANVISSSQGIPHETYGPPKFREY